jgi:hypothetical protein
MKKNFIFTLVSGLALIMTLPAYAAPRKITFNDAGWVYVDGERYKEARTLKQFSAIFGKPNQMKYGPALRSVKMLYRNTSDYTFWRGGLECSNGMVISAYLSSGTISMKYCSGGSL